MNAHPDQQVFLPMTRSMRMRIEATIEQLVALLDEIDGDPDREDSADVEPDVDDEPSLGALNDLFHQGAWGFNGYGYGEDHELAEG